VSDNRILFNSLISTYIEGPYRVTQRAAGAVTEIASQNPSVLKPHFKGLIKALKDPGASNAMKRNTIRMFQFVAIPTNHHGQIIELCFKFLQEKRETIAVKVFAMSVLEILTRQSQELRRELRIVIEDQLPYSGPAFISRGSKILKKL
jgi:uncharacterized protein (DUF305 family)